MSYSLVDQDYNDSRFSFISKLGEGTFGIVRKARDIHTNKMVAVKQLFSNDVNEGANAYQAREASILMHVQHENVVCAYAVYKEGDEFNIVMEYIPTDLDKLLSKMYESDRKLSPEEIKSFSMQLLLAIDHIHSLGILHRDIKPSNLLITDDDVLKVGDFGQARQISVIGRTYTKEVCTIYYRAPELLLGTRRYSQAMDIWSIGCVLIELVTLIPAFPGNTEIDQLYRYFKILGRPDEVSWPGVTSFRNWTTPIRERTDETSCLLSETFPDILAQGVHFEHLLKCLLTLDPAKRISAHEALKHPYFKKD